MAGAPGELRAASTVVGRGDHRTSRACSGVSIGLAAYWTRDIAVAGSILASSSTAYGRGSAAAIRSVCERDGSAAFKIGRTQERNRGALFDGSEPRTNLAAVVIGEFVAGIAGRVAGTGVRLCGIAADRTAATRGSGDRPIGESSHFNCHAGRQSPAVHSRSVF